MKLDDCYQLGYIVKKHGLKGELNIFLDVDAPDDYKDLESVFVEINTNLVPFFIEHIQIKQQKAIVRFEDVDTIERAEELIGCGLYLPLTTLPQLDGNDFYFHEIIGFTLEDRQSGKSGVVTGVNSSSHQDLLVTEFEGKEVLIPIQDELIESLDREKKLLTMTLPNGLLDIYLND